MFSPLVIRNQKTTTEYSSAGQKSLAQSPIDSILKTGSTHLQDIIYISYLPQSPSASFVRDTFVHEPVYYQ